MAGWRRAASILKSEESKNKKAFAPKTDPSLFVKTAETDPYAALEALPTASSDADLDAALTSLVECVRPLIVSLTRLS